MLKSPQKRKFEKLNIFQPFFRTCSSYMKYIHEKKVDYYLSVYSIFHLIYIYRKSLHANACI